MQERMTLGFPRLNDEMFLEKNTTKALKKGGLYIVLYPSIKISC